jgi:uncharacterized protein
MKIMITAGDVSLPAELEDTPEAAQFFQALPIEGRANLWGDEIYFAIPLSLEQAEGARVDMEVGSIAYWPPGEAFCIFFGPTPASHGLQPRAASPVNILGKILGDATLFRSVRNGAIVMLEQA